MAAVVTVEQSRQMEERARQGGLTVERMMENAGQAVAEEILRRIPAVEGLRVVVLVGSGNNGGDGLIAAERLAQAGAQVGVYLVRPRKDDDPWVARVRDRGLLVARADQDQRYRVLKNLVASSRILVDAILGTGSRLPLEGSVAEVLRWVQTGLEEMPERAFVVAVDCASGIDCDTGNCAEETLEADLTVTLGAAKIGQLVDPAAARGGELVVADIGIPPLPDPDAIQLVSAADVLHLLPHRPRHGHKGTFGRVMVVAGSVNYPGAAGLAARAAYRAGAGLVTIASPSPIQILLAGSIPEATWVLLPHEQGVIAEAAAEVLLKEVEGTTAIVLGPGFGQEPTTAAFVQSLFGLPRAAAGRIGFVHRVEPTATGESRLPRCVIDADGLKLLARFPGWPSRLPKGSILTPHPGEMATLTGMSAVEIQADRVRIAIRFAQDWDQVVVLKGAFTVVASGKRANVMPFATSALAHAGTGDVLAGALAGLLAQGMEAFEAATLGAFLHGRAGQLAARHVESERSVLAGDVAGCLASAFAELEGRRFRGPSSAGTTPQS